ncbi:MAG: 50S ribosomal protein L4 [Candidatus Promineifilaceae bacterium]|nr:50S ribosomal protein L4 [Candidatus Promineifilaceae bacterium]
MELPVYNMEGQEVDTVELPADIFEAKVNRGLMHQALVRQLANARLGTHSTKTRSEVRYSTAKVWRQKGTGRARHGSKRAPIFVGGGVAHGPRPRSYEKKMPRQMRRGALRSALSVKAGAGDIVVVDELAMSRPKTKDMVAVLERLTDGDVSILLLIADGADGDATENVLKSARNLPNVKTLRANYLNIRDLLGYDKIVMPLAALETIQQHLGRETEVYVLAASDEEVEVDEEEEDDALA